MAGFALNLSGLDNLTKRLNSLDNNLRVEIISEMSASALRIETKAKRNAPVNLGTLRQSIHSVSDTGGLTHKVIASASYAPYVEFGTGGKVSIPAGYEDFAVQFKGKGSGTLEDLIQALIVWVKRKGLAGTYQATAYDVSSKKASKIKRTGTAKVKKSEDEKLARFLAFKILKNGLRAQPFLIPAYEEEKPILFNKLKKLLNA
ncbi:phge_HK97_gp10, phage protein, HK97 gp10 family [uncultured Caudovirales phage]|uniref:Phge_HK97_gp10, phage protein, HK97 gp10 family n=1 Tax=uncultured Caudovirales phage TaxID=2100421 RepID=A0A6J7WNG2_9CAUD|nr:phge_HK97_gp10, phage protein, HK97 gp10 family [uncultured Caudovirales phage]